MFEYIYIFLGRTIQKNYDAKSMGNNRTKAAQGKIDSKSSEIGIHKIGNSGTQKTWHGIYLVCAKVGWK